MPQVRSGFRFDPPSRPVEAGVAWVLVQALAVSSRPLGPPASADSLIDTAERLALLPRLATQFNPAAWPSAPGVAERLRRERAAAVAHEMRLDATLAGVAAAAAALGLAPALLKGPALVLGGYSAPGGRPSGDLDLLVAVSGLDALHQELRRRGFREIPTGAEHHTPSLHWPGGVTVELHRHLPGVRLAGRGFAGWTDLKAAGLLGPAALRDGLLLPARDLLVAHALVHGLAQHGLHGGFPGWRLIGDLIDLGVHPRELAEPAARWPRWIEREVSRREIAAAVEVARLVAAGENPLATPNRDDAGRLAHHFVAAALDPDYGEALKLRWLQSPLSERAPLAARLRLLAHTLAPRRHGGQRGQESFARRLGRWLLRPALLAGKAWRAVRARQRLRTADQARRGRPHRS